MTPQKRVMDIAIALVLTLILAPVILAIALIMLITDRGPVFYVAERMHSPTKSFALWKFRTMRVVEVDSGVSGGDKADRITPFGRWLRRTRADELPQLWNVLRGDISFVGPRPPLRRYVELFPDLYAKVLEQRPGITGLATLIYHNTEERLLLACKTPEETETTYVTRCVPRKAALDRIYAERQTLCFDLRLMVATVFRRYAPGQQGKS